MGTVGFSEAFVIFIVALVLFGPKKLPELGRTIGKAISEFRRASSDLKASFEREMNNLERETEALKEPANTIGSAPAIPYDYEYGNYDSYNPETYQQTSTTPSTVSATEHSGAESNGTPAAEEHPPAAIAAPAVEGTVPRTEATPQHS